MGLLLESNSLRNNAAGLKTFDGSASRNMELILVIWYTKLTSSGIYWSKRKRLGAEEVWRHVPLLTGWARFITSRHVKYVHLLLEHNGHSYCVAGDGWATHAVCTSQVCIPRAVRIRFFHSQDAWEMCISNSFIQGVTEGTDQTSWGCSLC